MTRNRNRNRNLACLLTLATLSGAVLAVSPPALAGTATTAELLGDYNLITTGDVGGVTNVYGRALIGGSLNAAGNAKPFVGTNLTVADVADNADTLVVFGNVTGQNLADVKVQRGDALVGGTISPNNNIVAFQGGGTLKSTAGFDWSVNDIASALSGLSQSYASLATNSSVSTNGNQVTFDAYSLAPSAFDVAVFDFTEAQFEAVNSSWLPGDLNTASTVIINVAGSDLDMTNSVNFAGDWAGAGREGIIWNFYEAQSLSITKTFQGSILAPLAEVTLLNADIDGSVYADSFSGRQVHGPSFNAPTLPGDGSAIPTPQSAAAIAGGLLALANRRRRNAAA